MMKIKRGVLALLMMFASAAVPAQTWPARPVKVITGYGAGGAIDVVTRAMTDELTKRMGQAFIVENRPGAAGLLAAQAVKAAPADGYTILAGSVSSIGPVFVKSNPLDAAKELQPVSLMALGDWFIFARGDLGVGTLKELAVKGNSGRLKFGTLAPAIDALMAVAAQPLGLKYEVIPYKTTDQVMAALLSGDIDFTMNSLAAFSGQIQAGKIRSLATFSSARTTLTPNVPTAKEQGVNMEIRFNQGVWAPLGTPKDVVGRLSAAVTEAVKAPAAAERIAALQEIATGSTPEELLRVFQAEVRTYEEAAKLVGLQPQ
jgi:tripartite-type tricarboxylate transporter receptor subunit TctC